MSLPVQGWLERPWPRRSSSSFCLPPFLPAVSSTSHAGITTGTTGLAGTTVLNHFTSWDYPSPPARLGPISSEYNGYGQDFDQCFLTTGKIRVAGCNAPGVRTGSQGRHFRRPASEPPSLRHRAGPPLPSRAPPSGRPRADLRSPPLSAAVGLARKRLMRRRRRALALQGLVRRPRTRGIRLATGRLQRLLPRRGW